MFTRRESGVGALGLHHRTCLEPCCTLQGSKPRAETAFQARTGPHSEWTFSALETENDCNKNGVPEIFLRHHFFRQIKRKLQLVV